MIVRKESPAQLGNLHHPDNYDSISAKIQEVRTQNICPFIDTWFIVIVVSSSEVLFLNKKGPWLNAALELKLPLRLIECTFTQHGDSAIESDGSIIFKVKN